MATPISSAGATMSSVAQTALQELRMAREALDPEDVFATTRRTFVRRRVFESAGSLRRGPKRRADWKVKIFLLQKANTTFLPTPQEMAYIQRNGLGYHKPEVTCVDRNGDLTDLEDQIIGLYPDVPLGLVGFNFARCHQGRRIMFVKCDSLMALEQQIAKGKLYIIPKRDISIPPIPPMDMTDDTDLDPPNRDRDPPNRVPPNRDPPNRDPPNTEYMSQSDIVSLPDLHDYTSVQNDGMTNAEIRDQQDHACRESLMADQMKDRKQEALEKYSSYLTQTLMKFIGTLDCATELFQVFVPGRPENELLDQTCNGRLSTFGILHPTVVSVKLIEPTEEQMEEIASRNSEGTNDHRPVRVSSRAAAVRANQTIRNATRALMHESPVNVRWPSSSSSDADSDMETTLPIPNTLNRMRDLFRSQDVIDLTECPDDMETKKKTPGQESEVQTLIQEHSQKELSKDTEDFMRLNIRRTSLIKDAFRCLKLNNKNLKKPLRITFVGEPGHDDGGLRREFGAILVQAVAYSNFIDGTVLARDEALLDQQKFFLLGQLCSLTILQGGIGLPLFSPAMVDYVLENRVLCTTPQAAIDKKLMAALEKVEACTDPEQLRENIDDWLPNRMDYGHRKPASLLTLEDKASIIRISLKYEAVLTRLPELDQFKEGLKTLNVLDLMQGHPSAFRPLFLHSDEKLTLSQLETILTPMLSEDGSNKHKLEMDILINWNVFILTVDGDQVDNIKLEDVLFFVTGSHKVPVEGFNANPTIVFDHTHREFCGFSRNHMCMCPYPSANTCSCELKLPTCKRLVDDDQSQIIFTRMIVESPGFGMV